MATQGGLSISPDVGLDHLGISLRVGLDFREPKVADQGDPIPIHENITLFPDSAKSSGFGKDAPHASKVSMDDPPAVKRIHSEHNLASLYVRSVKFISGAAISCSPASVRSFQGWL